MKADKVGTPQQVSELIDHIRENGILSNFYETTANTESSE